MLKYNEGKKEREKKSKIGKMEGGDNRGHKEVRKSEKGRWTERDNTPYVPSL